LTPLFPHQIALIEIKPLRPSASSVRQTENLERRLISVTNRSRRKRATLPK
jgi:hypothetical protein